MVELLKYNGNPIGLELPPFVELKVAYTEPGVKGDSSSGTRNQACQAGDRPGNPGSALHQRRRKGEGVYGEPLILEPRLILSD